MTESGLIVGLTVLPLREDEITTCLRKIALKTMELS